MKIDIKEYGVTYPKGFLAAFGHCGLKGKKDDIALVYSEVPAVCALMSTTNKVKAAPVLWDKKVMEKTPIKQMVFINTGSANCCTGEAGYKDAEETAKFLSTLYDCPEDEILLCSTGVIGLPLEMDKLLSGIKKLKLDKSNENGLGAAAAIHTTDTKVKVAATEFKLGEKTVRIGAMVKGSGMIRPGMATMISVATTDVDIDADVLKEIFKNVTSKTYNMVSVDGDMSTNDTAIVMANGQSENKKITDIDSEEARIFEAYLLAVQTDLAKKMAADGEGATTLIETHVTGAKNEEEAKNFVRSINESSLVKTAIFGKDANWGRILCALGYAAGELDPAKTKLSIRSTDTIDLFEGGEILDYDEDHANEVLKEDTVYIDVDLGLGEGEATGWGCDLSYDYVKINGEYRT